MRFPGMPIGPNRIRVQMIQVIVGDKVQVNLEVAGRKRRRGAAGELGRICRCRIGQIGIDGYRHALGTKEVTCLAQEPKGRLS